MLKQNVISVIEGALPTLRGNNLTIATYILEHRHEVPSMSTEEIARVCGVGEAAIVRFARMMGCNGYRSFKIELSAANAVRDATGMNLADVRPEDSPGEIADKLSVYTMTSIENTNAVLDRGELERAVNLIDDAYKGGHKIYLAGLGASSTVVRSFEVKLMRLHVPTVYHQDIHLQLESMMGIEKGDVLVCFSVLGRSVENDQLVGIARRRGCDVIVVTQHGKGGVAEKATCVLLTSCVESKTRIASQTGLIVQMFVADVLFASLAMRYIDALQAAVAESRTRFVELNHYSA